MRPLRPVDDDEPRTVVKISGPADILGVLPHRLGFHPTESLVVICLEGPRRRDRLVMRLDLADERYDDAVVADVVRRVQHVGASGAALVCYTDHPVDGPDVLAGAGGSGGTGRTRPSRRCRGRRWSTAWARRWPTSASR